MRISTKFNIGDICFKMFKNEIKCYEIEDIKVEVYLNTYKVVSKQITYSIREENGLTYETVLENEIFKTKKDLLKTL